MKNNGFTLIEVLIALSIFAIISTVTSLTLLNIFNTRSTIISHADSLADLQTSYHLLRQDLSMLAKRFFYDQNQQKMGVFIGELDGFSFNRQVSYTGHGAGLEKISYQYKAHHLWRHTWSNENTIDHSQQLLKSIKNFKIHYIDANHLPRDKWFTPNQSLCPTAISISVSLENQGPLEWLIKIPNELKYEQNKAP